MNKLQVTITLTIGLAGCTPSEATATQTLEALWKALLDHYPMPEYVGVRDDRWMEELRPRVAAAPDREAAFELMDELVCRFNDYHTALDWKGRPAQSGIAARTAPVLRDAGAAGRIDRRDPRPFTAPPAELDSFEPYALAVVSAPPSSPLRPGDEVLTLDGVAVEQGMKRAWRHSRGSSRLARLREAAWRIFMGPPGTSLRLGIARQGGTMEVTVAHEGWEHRPVLSTTERDGVPVVRITEWSDSDQALVAAIDAVLDSHRGVPGIVFDVRDNSGGSDALADQVVGRFLDRPVISSISFMRLPPRNEYRRMVAWTPPRGPWRFPGRAVVLIDEGCMSACEHFASGMAEAGALLVGTATDGACGWIDRVELPGEATLSVSRTFPLHTGGIPSPFIGIHAPEQVAPVLADLIAGRDRPLEVAVQRARGH